MQAELKLNAFTGAPDPGSKLHAQAKSWIAGAIPGPPEVMRGPPSLADPAKWKDPNVGWGLVLPDDSSLSPAEKATADDAPEPLQRLLAHREGVVLRWSPELPVSKIRRYYADGSAQDPHLALSERGTAKGQIPRYLLLYGPPTKEKLPWELQYRLSAVAFTGRLDLDGQALANYVDAVLSNWDGAAALATRALTWAVDHGGDDITRLMRTVVAKKVHKQFAADADMLPVFLDGRQEPATGAMLISALEAQRPGMIITTSHGMTGPLNQVDTMRAQMGIPVDANFGTLDLDALLTTWSPDGAIWYAHACCSAGCDAITSYDGLIDEGSHAAEVLSGVAACGALVSPLPKQLLGAQRPLRAFLGHVEPTFDWTLKDQSTGQVLTNAIAESLYNRLYQPLPIGFAFEAMHDKAGSLEIMHKQAKRRATQGESLDERESSLREALTCRLVAQDLQSLVLLGDPAEVPVLQ